MRSTPEIDARLKARLQEAVERFSDGNVEAFGKRIGYANGGYIRQCLQDKDPRPVRAVLIGRVHQDPDMRGWFDGVLPPLVAADVRDERRQAGGWPFKRLTLEEWESLGELQAVVEDAAVQKARELLRERAELAGSIRKRLRAGA